MKKLQPLVFIIILIILFRSSGYGSAAFPSTSDNFSFTLLDGTTTTLSEYQDKPIVMDWSASWCTFCKENQKMFDNVYGAIEDHVNLITIVYGGQSDDLDDAKAIRERGPYEWTFAFDHSDYSAIADTQNADVWIMDSNLNIKYSWDHAILDQSDFLEKLSEVVGVDINVEEEVQTFGLFENPFFLGFLVISGIGIIVVVISRFSGSS